MKFFEFAPGKVKNIYVDESIIGDLLVFQLDIKPGSIIRNVRNSSDRPGYFVVAGENRDQVLKKEKDVENTVKIEYEK